ncbi:transporter substrate-binding domain-containing protein [Cellulomonas hominis]|uniref:Basic amino acid ABC transporter substrate-binding protein n=1 Tax=Cellulomonas hominis TaxID=156981 RepID=A0A511FAE5_9CELL|nr:transporter substrate-binding domain-containing protein [Cellulomonas hominis]MBB5471407.1 polar amino acid transport system substrate-binding protein [Cellulomonas hominis]MBU5423848.1 transporter substrate-binding domain-containing protein [Cellulomonas hominis]NKY06511.1 transporter substrate-binding domain-containing protein [Cellulomonas hominis]NKY11081.1 transporter substrate-binding domain-containing protein [Cellulomonas hominis]GEL46236.1 basic amino acid ABC transporter substrate
MRTRHLAALPAALAATLLLAACGGGDDAGSGDPTADGGVALVQEGSLTVCTNPPFEPFEYEEDGEIVGLDMAIVGEVAKDLGVELVTKVTPFEGIQSGADLNTGNCDIVASGITITEERQAKFDFSEPYFDADQGLLVPEGSDIDSLEALEGKSIAVQQATTGETWAQENGLQTVQFEDLGLQVQALKTGQVDAAINDIAVLGPFVTEGFEVSANFSTGEQYGLGVKKGSTALLDAVNGTLERIREDGTYDELYTQYIGTAPVASSDS